LHFAHSTPEHSSFDRGQNGSISPAGCERDPAQDKSMRNRILTMNSPDPDDYAGRHYDASWRSVKAGALLAILIVAIAFLV